MVHGLLKQFTVIQLEDQGSSLFYQKPAIGLHKQELDFSKPVYVRHLFQLRRQGSFPNFHRNFTIKILYVFIYLCMLHVLPILILFD
jgi:hypothetical protein